MQNTTDDKLTFKDRILIFFEKPLWLTIIQSGFILFFTVLPYIVECASGWLYNRHKDHFVEGQFLTYSIALISSSLVTWICMERLRNTFKKTVNLISVPIICLLGLLYGMLIVNQGEKPNYGAVYSLSLISFCITFAIFFHSQYISNKRTIDVAQESRNQTQKITNAIKTD